MILSKKLDSKEVKYDIENLFERKENYKFAWDNSLRTLMSEIPYFDQVFDKAINILKIYSNL